ncbi:hypothetical protein Vau01_052900 [Virgisporangium aurantiacum]|uniref:Uncharacterized protein n=1 Tax=Virgisporangium aurantiacum TaxID=175570 RepID=A0A8J4E192_9ACTN|nr:hypothetical protein Vau01_052900 [Virgisporangium aurantiacum]
MPLIGRGQLVDLIPGITAEPGGLHRPDGEQNHRCHDGSARAKCEQPVTQLHTAPIGHPDRNLSTLDVRPAAPGLRLRGSGADVEDGAHHETLVRAVGDGQA